jgi:hypothetical protein
MAARSAISSHAKTDGFSKWQQVGPGLHDTLGSTKCKNLQQEWTVFRTPLKLKDLPFGREKASKIFAVSRCHLQIPSPCAKDLPLVARKRMKDLPFGREKGSEILSMFIYVKTSYLC